MAQERPAGLAEFDLLRRRLSYALLALLLLLLVGTVGFVWMGGGIVDAFYMTVITLTTVGYSEIIPMDANPGGRMFTVVLLLIGMGIVAYAVPLLAAFLIEGHFLHVFSRRRMQKKIEAMSGHYIVCGSTPASRHVAEELAKTGRSVVLIVATQDERDAVPNGIADVVVVGDSSDDQILLSAGVERAAGVVAALASDKDNVIVTLTARRLAPAARIIAAADLAANDPKLRVAGADAVVSPPKIGGLRMASELVRPTVVSFLDKMLRDKDVSLRVEEVRVPETSAYVGRSLADLKMSARSGALLLAVVPSGQERFEFNPSPERRIEADLTLVVMASTDMRARLEQALGA